MDTLHLDTLAQPGTPQLGMSPPGTCSAAESSAALPGEDEVRSRAAALVRHLVCGGCVSEQRSSSRYAFPRLVRLVPIDSAGRLLTDEAIVGVGKNVSVGGMSAFHQQPLPYRHVLACIEMDADTSFQIPLDLNWCRFTRLGWYESGGRFSATSGVAAPTLSGASLIPRDREELLP